MKRFGLAFILACLCSSSVVFGQSSPIQGEFIESSSPLPGGGTVTTRSEPGRRVQTTVTVSPSSSSSRNSGGNLGGSQNPPARTASTSNGTGSSVLDRSVGSASGAADSSGGSGNRYPYPANYLPNTRAGFGGQGPVARTAGLQNSSNVNVNNVNQQVNTSRVQYQNNCCQPVACCAPAIQSGLGLRPAPNLAAQNFNVVRNPNPLPQIGGTQAGFGGGAGFGGVQPTLSQAPQVGLQNGVGNFGAGQFNAGSGSLFGNSGRTGSVYQPLFPLLRMPQGSYLGQGVIGQPEAYVNNQPLRNFFRYLLPF